MSVIFVRPRFNYPHSMWNCVTFVASNTPGKLSCEKMCYLEHYFGFCHETQRSEKIRQKVWCFCITSSLLLWSFMPAIKIISLNNGIRHQIYQQSFTWNVQKTEITINKHTFDDQNSFAMWMYDVKFATSLIPWRRQQMEKFSHYGPFVRGIHRSPANSPHKGQWRGALMFFWSAPE